MVAVENANVDGAGVPVQPLVTDVEAQSRKDTQDRAVVDDPAMWAITYQQLMELEETALNLFGKKEYSKATMRNINRAIIKPTCQEMGKSYALSLDPNGLKLDAFITHAWDESFKALVESVRHVFVTTMHKPNLWICALALFQGDSEAVAAQVGSQGDSLEDSSFVRALSKASMYVVARNATVDVYSRIWCVAELIHSKKLGLIPERSFVTGPAIFSDLKTSCLDAQAYNPKDRDKILKILLTEHDREEIDDFVHQFRSFESPRKKQARFGLMLGISPCAVVLCLIAMICVVAIVSGVVVSRGDSAKDNGTPGHSTQYPTPQPTPLSTTQLPTPLPTLLPETQQPTPNPTRNPTPYLTWTQQPSSQHPIPQETPLLIPHGNLHPIQHPYQQALQ